MAPVTRRLGILALFAAAFWWFFLKKFPCPYCEGRGWNWEPRREVWYVVSCDRCQEEETTWSTDIPVGREEGRIVGDREFGSETESAEETI